MSDKVVSRREFLVQGLAAAGCLTAGPAIANGLSAPVPDGRKVLHIIGHSHIDAAWLWPWRDGADVALNTFRSALNRMKENPGFCYSHSSAAHYRWVQQADPAMFEEVKQRIREGRWEVVGGWPVEPDCNIPSTESFIRQSLYGKRYCESALGVDVRVGFNPDSFGHAAGLPNVLHRAGYDTYVFMRPQEWEMDLPLLFWWGAADGSRLLTLRIWKEYSAKATAIPDAVQHVFAPGINDGAFFLGVGDHGGAVTAEQVRQVTAMQSDSSLPELRWSTLAQFFAAVRRSPAFASLPVVSTELQHHSRGCYSAYGQGKANNRRAEQWLGEAECISTVSGMVGGPTYPAADYAEAWWKVCFCQFHDSMAGTSLYADYRDVRDSLGYACEVAQTSKISALEAMAKRVDTRAIKESALFAFNPLPWPRKAIVEFHSEKNPDGLGLLTTLKNPDGSTVPVQFRPPDSMTLGMPRLTALIDLPACGYKVLEIGHEKPPAGLPYNSAATPSETGFGLGSVKAPDGAELLAGPIGLVVISDTSDTWAHDVVRFSQEMGRPQLISAEVVEDGPVTRVTRHRARWMDSEIILDMAQYAGLDALELRFVIDWHEKEQMLKLEIPTALEQPRVFLKVPGEVIERKTNGEEEPYQDWAAVQGRIGASEYTVGILNDSSYSYDCLQGRFRTVVIRSAPFARHRPGPTTFFDTNAWQDQGRQERRFWLTAGKGNWSAMALDRRAMELQMRSEYVVDSAHTGTQPREQSFIEIQPSSVSVLALKRAESGDATILRIQESVGTSTSAHLSSTPIGLNETVTLAPWEIKTLRIQRQGSGPAHVKEVSLLEV